MPAAWGEVICARRCGDERACSREAESPASATVLQRAFLTVSGYGRSQEPLCHSLHCRHGFLESRLAQNLGSSEGNMVTCTSKNMPLGGRSVWLIRRKRITDILLFCCRRLVHAWNLDMYGTSTCMEPAPVELEWSNYHGGSATTSVCIEAELSW